MGKKCSICGNEIEIGQKYCNVCGAPVEESIEQKSNEEYLEILEKPNRSSISDNTHTSQPEFKQDNTHTSQSELKQAKNGSKKGIVLPLLVILLIALAGTAVIVSVIRLFHKGEDSADVPSIASVVDDVFDGGEEKTGPEKYNTKGPKITCFDGMIINSKGEYNDSFYSPDKQLASKDEWIYDDTFEHNQAVVVADGECYYIDTKLEYTLVAEGVDGAMINKDGGYIIYMLQDEDEMYYYSIKDNEARLIAENVGLFEHSAISNNGEYVVYYDYNEQSMMMYENSSGSTIKLLVNDYDCIAISDDGLRGYFKDYVDGNYAITYMNDTDVKVIDEKVDTTIIISNDCRQFLACGHNSLHFFSDDMEKCKVVGSNAYGDEIYFAKGDMTEKSDYCFGVNYSTLNELLPFAINSTNEICWVYDKNEDAVILNYFSLDKRCLCVHENRLEVLCLRDNKLMRQIVTGKDIHATNYDDLDKPVSYIKANKDMSIIYISMGGNVYSFDDGKVKLVEEGVKIWPDLDYEPYEDKFYFGKDLELYEVNGGRNTIKLAYDNYNGFKHLKARYDDYMVFEDTNGNLFVRVYGVTIPIEE